MSGVPLDDPAAICALIFNPGFHRGDANTDSRIDISDAVAILASLFLGGESPGCLEAANANNDRALDSSDGIYILSFLFGGGTAPPSPGPPTARKNLWVGSFAP